MTRGVFGHRKDPLKNERKFIFLFLLKTEFGIWNSLFDLIMKTKKKKKKSKFYLILKQNSNVPFNLRISYLAFKVCDFGKLQQTVCDGNFFNKLRGHLLSAHAKFYEELTSLTIWYAHVRVRIRGLEILLFRKIMCTHLMDDPFNRLVILGLRCKG